MNKRTSVLRFLAFRKHRTSFLRMLLDGVLGRNEIRSREKRRYQFEALEERRVLATMYAVDITNNVLAFDSATPGTISSNVAITGLFAGEQVVGIDTRPATGKVYALGLVDDGTTRTGRIYTLDPNSGVAVQVGGAPWSTTLPDTPNFGFNFNPNVDRIRIVNRDGGNFRVHPDTGALVATDTNLSSTGLNGVSYTNNDGSSSTTTLLGLNFDTEDLVTIGGLNGSPSPNGGVVNIIGDTGTVAFDSYGFEITAIGRTTTAFATTDGDLYTVNLSTGAFTLVGAIGGGTGSYLGLTAALNTIAVAGSTADDTVVVTASGPSSGTYSLNGGPAVPFANIASFSFIGGAGSDTLTINNPVGGLFAPTGGIDYHGGGQSGDALNLLGGGSAGLNQSYFVGTTAPPIGPGPGSNGDGLIRFTGTSAVDIRFTGLAPIVDTVVVASLTVNATDAANNISITNGAAPRLIVAVDAFEPIEFNNKIQLIVNAGDGVVGGDLADTVLLNFNNLPAGLTGITINADEGADTVSLQASSSVPVSLNGGDGLDFFNVGNSGLVGAPGLLTPIAGAVAVNGGAGGADLVVDGSGAGVAADYAITSTTVTRSLPPGFGGVTYSGLSNLLLTVGSGANVISVNSTTAGVPTNIATGAGDDSIVFANGVSLNGGTIDGGANIDTVNYSAYATSVTVNLGSNAPGGALAGVVDGGQENPGQITTATGTVSITNYNSATKTFDISAHVSGLLPTAVTGFHIHRAPIGVNGGIIIDLTTIFGLGSLIADGLGGFDFNAGGVSLPAQHEAAFLGGITYFNVHTATAPGGLIRGQILPSAVFTAAPGTATGTGGISNIENATGGTGADSLVGNLGVNVLLGNQGNDTIVGAPGNDTMNGGDNNDVIVWSNGDNNDIIDGALGADVVQVNGSIGGGDSLSVGASATRVAFARTNLVPFTLDIGTTEMLIVNGAGGDDTETVTNLAGVADLTAVNLFGLNGNDTFNTGFTIAPIVVSVNGGSHSTGDTLNLDAAGGPVFDNGVQLSKPGFNPVNYTQIENLAVINTGELTFVGSGIDDTLVVNATSANAGTYQLNAGLVTAFIGISKLTFNSAGGNDTLTINNPAGGLFAPTGGIDCNGGGQIGDSLNLLGGGGAGFNEIYFVGTTTPPAGGTTSNGDGLIRFTGATPVDIRFTGLAPIVDTVAVASLTVNSTDSANTIHITNGTIAPRVRVAVDFFESIEFDNKTAVIVNAGNGVDGDDLADTINVSFTNTPAALTAITINGNEGIDQVNVFGTAGVDTVAFTPTGFSSASLTGLGAPVNFATTERVIYDGNDAAALDNVTINGTIVNDTFDYDASILKGSFRSFFSPDFDTLRSARITVTGGGGGVDVVNVLGSAGTDTVTSAANAITVNTTGSAAIITLGAGTDAVTISTLDNNDNINLSGITVPSSVFGGDGNDTIVGSPQVDSIYGGAGNDTLVGGVGNDFEYGDEGNDTFGNLTLTPDGVADDAGADQAFGGEGFDNFVWEPGDGADFNNGGGDAADIFRFFGNAAANVFTLRQGGTPTHFNALIGALVIDNHGIEDVIVDGQGGADTFLVQDLYATEVVSINLNLGAADAAAIDPVTINGRNEADNLSVTSSGAGTLSVQGLRYNLNLTNAEATDTLTINGNDGDDQVTVAPGAEAVLTMTLNGNNGDDRLTGNVAFMNGADGNDTLVGGAGNQTMDGGAGDDAFVGDGGSDNVGGGAGSSIGDTILVTGTDGADVFNISLSPTGQLLVNINGLITTYGDFLSGPIANSGIEQIRVQGLAGNDALTVDSTNGAIPIVINFDGGNNADTLTLTGGTATSDTYAVGPNIDQGTSTVVIGGVTQIVRFNALEPVIDLVAGPLTVVATDADNAINYSQGGVAANGLVSIDGFETIEFSNKTALTINALSGSDTINLNNPNTPTGLTGITVNGGDPTGSDRVIVNGTAAADAVVIIPTASDAATITGVGPAIAVTTVEHLTYNGLGGNDTVTFVGTAGNDAITHKPGTTDDAGNLRNNSLLTLDYQNLGATGAVNVDGMGSDDTLVAVGTTNSDAIRVASVGAVNINTRLSVNPTSIENLRLDALEGDDAVNIDTTFAGPINVVGSTGINTLTVNGLVAVPELFFVVPDVTPGSGAVNANTAINYTGISGVSLNGNLNDSLVIIDTAENSTWKVGSAPFIGDRTQLDDRETVDYFGFNDVQLIATTGSDTFVIRPTGLSGSATPLVVFGGPVGSTDDRLVILGTTGNDAFVLNANNGGIGGAQGTVSLNGTNVVFGDITAIELDGQAGNDIFNITALATTSVFVDGGDPIGVLPGDQLVVNGAVGFFAGPENDEGGVLTGGGTVSFDHIESLTVAAIVGCPFLILGTNADDDITVIARDASTTAGADGVQDFTFSVNQGLNVVVLNQSDLFIDALAGDDDIVLRTAAPNEADWDVNVRVAGGSPSIGAPLEADRLVLETPNNAAGFDDIVFNPTGKDTGNLVIDENANGTYEAAGTDSLITFGSFVMVCPPANFTYTSTAGGVELIQVNGEGAPAIDDSLTINGTALDDTTVVKPSGIGAGTFASGASPQFIFQSFDSVAVNPGAGGFDHVEINGSAGPDTVTSNANTVTLGGEVTLGAGIDQVDINTFDGNDNVTLTLAVLGLKKVVNLGAGNDRADLSGVAVDPADPVIYGGDGDDIIIGSPNADFIFGGSGTDVILGLGGIDYIDGGDGNDTITGGTGNDTLHGGAGSDVITWNNGDNTDVVEGGTGDDRAVVNGAGVGDIFTVFADATNPSRIAFNRTNLVPFALDIADVEEFDINSGNGADNITVGDLTTTALRELDLDVGVEAGIADAVTVNGRNTADQVQILGAGSVMTISGLRYDVRVANALAADADDFTFNANGGDDSVLAADSVAAFFTSANTAAANHFRLNGGDGHDRLEGYGSLDGQAGDDTLIGSATIAAASGNQLFVGGDGDDSMVGGTGADTFDGGVGFDTILVRGTPGNDVIDISQTVDVTLVETVNSVVETDTLILIAGTRTVERVSVVADAGNDTIRVQWADVLGTDANVNSLGVDVDGGAGSTGDRLGVVDLGIGDLILYERGTTNDSGAMAIGPGNAEPLIVTFSDIETAQPIAGVGGDVVVFKHDPFEFNNARTLATYLGAGETINVDPTINPGLDAAFGFPADEDWFRVVAEKTGVLDFQVYFRQVATVGSGRPGLPNAGNLDIAVTDEAGNVIAGFGNNDNSNDERIRIPAVAGQTYYLRVFANGSALNTYNITVDSYAPPVPRDMELLDNPVGDLANSDTGRSQSDNITRDNTPTLVFRLDDGIFLNDLPGNSGAGAPPDEVIPIGFQAAAGTAGYRIAIFDEGNSPLPGNQTGTAPQTPIGFATFVSAGIYQFTTPLLTDGSHFLTARVQMVDPATPQQTGFGDRSVALEVIVDTVVPPAFFGNSASVTDGLHRDSDSGIATVIASFADRITNDTTPTMYGSAEANAIIRLFVDRTNNGFTADDILLGQTVARPLDGTNQALGEWDITATTSLNSPDIVAAIGKDGVRNLFITAEDVAGNVSTAVSLSIMLDTTPAIITAVTLPNGDSVFQVKPTPTPTPRVDFMTVTFTGGPASAGGFALLATDPSLAANVRNYQLVGDHNGNILISSAAVVSQSDTTVVVRLNFSRPLPDDRFTLTLDDSIADAANNALDGESQSQSPGLAGNVLPSGNGISGGDFKARFTVDSRPEVGVVSEGIVYVDINGNYLWDPQGINNDSTNRDLVFQFGQLVDAHFAGNFAPVGAVAASGYDKLGAYGKFAGTYSFVLDTNDDGVADFSSLMPAAYQVNGIPVAGNFNAAHPGDEIGLFDGAFWYVDTNGNNQIDLGERIASSFNGLPIVGDFDGNGTDDFAAFNNSTNTFTFDTNRDGNADFTWRVADDVQRFVGLSGFTDRPVAGDLNLDGIDDIGLWVKDRQGTLPRDSGEYFFWVSDRSDPNPANVFDSYSPDPLGNDLFAEFGDELGLPIFGNFDPPVVGSGDLGNPLHNTPSPLDVDSDGFVSPLDVLVVVNVLNQYPAFPSSDPVRTFYTIGQRKADPNNDRTINPLDVLTIINFLNSKSSSGSGEGEGSGSATDTTPKDTSSIDAVFSQMGLDVAEEVVTKKRRR